EATLYSPLYQYITSPTRTYNIRGSMVYNEPIGRNMQLSFQYRFNYDDQSKNQKAYYTDEQFENPQVNEQMSKSSESGYWRHRIGPGFRYSKNKNTIVANVYYQRSSLNGTIGGSRQEKIKKNFNDVTYFGMINYAFNKENSIRMFFRSSTDNPSITQLQNIFDVSTPQYLSIGNRNLNPSFTHRINFHYIHSNIEKGRTFMWMFSMQHQQNYISGSTWYNTGGFELPDSFGDIDIPTREDGSKYRPQRITSYENMDGYWYLRTHISLGLPLSFMKCNLNLMAGVNYSVIPSAIYQTAESSNILQNMIDHKFTTNHANNIGYDASVTLGSNISENIDFTLSWNGTYNQAWNTAAKTASGSNVKNNYFYHTASGSLKWVFWKGFTFTASCSYVQYIGFTNKYDESYVLCNLYLGKKLFRNNLGEIQIGVNDVANQNTAFARNTGSGYTQNLTNSVIGRYVCVQFVYNLRHFGKRGSKNTKDYDIQESKGGVGMSGTGNSGMRFGPPPGGGR
ncbi:MAG: outer membrane beta-barrel protein, partial [Alistipes sp.]